MLAHLSCVPKIRPPGRVATDRRGQAAERHRVAANRVGRRNTRSRFVPVIFLPHAGPTSFRAPGPPPLALLAQGCRSLAFRRSAPTAAVERDRARQQRSGLSPRPHRKQTRCARAGRGRSRGDVVAVDKLEVVFSKMERGNVGENANGNVPPRTGPWKGRATLGRSWLKRGGEDRPRSS